MGKYFGTDGFRGEANINLNARHAFEVGLFLGYTISCKSQERGKVVIGRDTRLSGEMFEAAISAGLTAAGVDVYLLGVTTTPNVAWLSRQAEFDCGVMISASHNPFQDNGIKLINHEGKKMPAEILNKIEAFLDGDDLGFEYASGKHIGVSTTYPEGVTLYKEWLKTIATERFDGLRIVLDCANGSASHIAESLFTSLGADVHVLSAKPNGLNINVDCGSTHIDALRDYMHTHKADIGFAFDGDADRCIAVDENGEVIDGDLILYLCGFDMLNKGGLNKGTVVTTVMANLGLFKAFDKAGIRYKVVDVGDKNVYQCIEDNDYSLGGEQSGHIIFPEHSTTGDGLLTALKVLNLMSEHQQAVSTLTSAVKIHPQKLVNVTTQNKYQLMHSETLIQAIEEARILLGNDGRTLVRASGTEPLIRIMVEASTLDMCDTIVAMLQNSLKNLTNSVAQNC